MFTRSDSAAANGSTTATLTAGSEAAGRTTLPAEYRTPRDLLRACVAATRAADAAIERRVDLEEAIALLMEEAGQEAVTFYDGPDYWVAIKRGGSTCLTRCATPTSLSLGALLPTTPAPIPATPAGPPASLADISDEEFEEYVAQVRSHVAADLALHPYARLVRPIPDEHDAELVASFALPEEALDDASPGPGYGDDVDTGEYPTLASLGVDVAVIDQEAG